MVRKLEVGNGNFSESTRFFFVASSLLGSQNVGSLLQLRAIRVAPPHPKVLPVLDLQSGVEAKHIQPPKSCRKCSHGTIQL